MIRYDDIAAWGMRQGWVYQSGMWCWLSIIGRDGTRTMARGPTRTTRMTVTDRQSFSERDGKTFYRADVEIDGVRKRLWLSAQQWARLGERTDFPACVSDGALGFVVVRSYTADCASAR